MNKTDNYTSDNAGIGDECNGPVQGAGWQCTESSSIGGYHYNAFVNAYSSQGGYSGPGITWDPCPNSPKDCWWVHWWNNGYTGLVGVKQNFKGASQDIGAITRRQVSPYVWDSVAFWVHGGIWQKYIDIGGPQACCWATR